MSDQTYLKSMLRDLSRDKTVRLQTTTVDGFKRFRCIHFTDEPFPESSICKFSYGSAIAIVTLCQVCVEHTGAAALGEGTN